MEHIDYRIIIAVGAAVICFGLSQWNGFKSQAYALMVQAKRLAKVEILKSGEEQELWVTDALQAIPYLAVIPYSVKRQLVKYLYNVAKDLVDDGQLNNSN